MPSSTTCDYSNRKPVNLVVVHVSEVVVRGCRRGLPRCIPSRGGGFFGGGGEGMSNQNRDAKFRLSGFVEECVDSTEGRGDAFGSRCMDRSKAGIISRDPKPGAAVFVARERRRIHFL